MLNERKKNNVNKETTIGTPFLEKISDFIAWPVLSYGPGLEMNPEITRSYERISGSNLNGGKYELPQV